MMGDSSVNHVAFSGREHTEYKLKILEKYLPAWFQILQKDNENLVYIDCYAGIGRYPDGTEGSPLRAVKIADEASQRWNTICWCIFNDNNPERLEELTENISEYENRPKLKIKMENIKAEHLVKEIIANDNLLREIGNDAPMFFFIDPLGFNVPMEMICEILSRPKTEILLTFMIKDIERWGDTHGYQNIIRRLFDLDDPQSYIRNQQGAETEERILRAFKQRLYEKAHTQYIMTYKVCHEKERRTIFYMVHISTHFKAFKLMKDCMYSIGIPGVFAYLGPDHPIEGQLTLEPLLHDTEIAQLASYIFNQFNGCMVDYKMIEEVIYVNTSYITKHCRHAMNKLEQDGKVVSFGRGKRGGIKDTTTFQFI